MITKPPNLCVARPGPDIDLAREWSYGGLLSVADSSCRLEPVTTVLDSVSDQWGKTSGKVALR